MADGGPARFTHRLDLDQLLVRSRSADRDPSLRAKDPGKWQSFQCIDREAEP